MACRGMTLRWGERGTQPTIRKRVILGTKKKRDRSRTKASMLSIFLCLSFCLSFLLFFIFHGCMYVTVVYAWWECISYFASQFSLSPSQSRKPIAQTKFRSTLPNRGKSKGQVHDEPNRVRKLRIIGRTQTDTDTDAAPSRKTNKKQRQKEFRMHNYVYRCRHQLVEVGNNKIEKIFRGATCNECVCILLCSDRLLLSSSTKEHCWRYRVPRPSLSSHSTCSTLRLSWYAHGCIFKLKLRFGETHGLTKYEPPPHQVMKVSFLN